MKTDSTLYALSAAPAVAAAVAPVAASALMGVLTKPDPIYAAIEAHRQAAVNRDKIPDTADELGDAIDGEYAALLELFRTAPTTHEGMLALLQYLQEPLHVEDGGCQPFGTVIEEFASMYADNRGYRNPWSPTQWVRLMELRCGASQRPPDRPATPDKCERAGPPPAFFSEQIPAVKNGDLPPACRTGG